jgi:RHS repeat-associated protein
MKLGHFSITFAEAEVPLQGIPIRITRTYDTRQSKEKLDFGYGWSIDYQNVRIRESRKLGFSWTMTQQGGGFSPFCVRPSGSPTVTVTLPDGETEQFRAKWSPECQQFLPPIYGSIVFEPVNSKTQSKLEQTDYGTLRVTNSSDGTSNIIDPGESSPVDPQHYRLTTEEGMVYELDQAFGVKQITDQAGNTITYTDDGIVHSSGTRVDFVKDAQKRITDIILPDGRRLKYRYDAKGDLISAADQADLATTFGYLPNIRYPHYLKDITDARGIQAIRHEYDNDGRLVKSIDADGNPIEYTHNIAGRTEIIKNRRGFATTYVYDANGWVLLEKNALGEEKTWTYDLNGNVLSQTDGLNRKTEFVVDARGNVLQEKDPLGAITRQRFGNYNQLIDKIDSMGRKTVDNSYFSNILTNSETNFLKVTQNALGNATRFTRDLCGDASCPNTGLIRTMISADGATAQFMVNRSGQMTRETNALGESTLRDFDTMGRVTSEKRSRVVEGVPQTLELKRDFDANGRPIQLTLPDGAIVKVSYNAIGLLASQTDARGNVKTFEYDARGMLKKTVNADGSFETNTFDAQGNLIASRDALGRTLKHVYDAADRMTETIYPDATPDDSDNPRDKTQYNAAGQVVTEISALGQSTRFEFDGAGRRTKIIDALGHATVFEYDSASWVLSVTDSAGRKTRSVYDAMGRVIETIYPDATPSDDSDNPRSKAEYDVVNRKIASIDETGRVTRYRYDLIGRLISVILPNPSTGANPPLVGGVSPAGSGTLVTSYEYDGLGNKVSQTDALGRVTRWRFDASGRLKSRTLPMGQVETVDYNPAGQISQRTDFNGVLTAFEYDIRNRLQKIVFPAQRERRFTYNVANEVIKISDDTGDYDFTYDLRGRLSQAKDPFARVVDYQYDAQSRRTRIQTAQQETNYQYDALNRMTDVQAVIAGVSQSTSYQFDAVGNRIGQVNPNGTVVAYGYDVRNRAQSILHRASAAPNAAEILRMDYRVDASGLRTRVMESRPDSNVAQPALTRVTDYNYDALKRLVGERVAVSSGQNRDSQWRYDDVGNRTSQSHSGSLNSNTTYSFDANDRLTAEPQALVTYQYDANGNQLSKKQGATIQSSYQWDEENRMIGATAGTKTTRYSYDPGGIRRSQVELDGSVRKRTEYLVDANRSFAEVLEEWGSAGATTGALPASTLTSSYAFGLERMSQQLPAQGGSQPQLNIYHSDALGSTRAISSINGAVSDRYAYTAFGETDPSAGSGWNAGSTANNYLFTGEQNDPNLSLYYLRARYMNPSTGRFVGQDAHPGSAMDPMSLHRYQYASASPLAYTDPSGMNNLAELGTATEVVGVGSTIGIGSVVSIDLAGAVAANDAVFMLVPAIAANDAVFVGAAAGGWAGNLAITSAAVALALSLAQNEQPQKKNPCRLIKCVPIVNTGTTDGLPATSAHILDAQVGAGHTSMEMPLPMSAGLYRAKAQDDAWYNSFAPCKDRLSGSGTVCDEYPFGSTLWGGKLGYQFGLVSLRLVPDAESGPQGALLTKFYGALNGANVSKVSENILKSFFIAVAMPGPSWCADRLGAIIPGCTP